jgi:hypothetical protein
MRRVIKVLAVAALIAVMLVASISPAMAVRVRGGVLLQTENPCIATGAAHNVTGSHLLLDPPGRDPGCWVQLPPSATQNE